MQLCVWNLVLLFFRWNVSTIWPIIVLKVAATVFTTLHFRTSWPNRLKFFFRSFKKNDLWLQNVWKNPRTSVMCIHWTEVKLFFSDMLDARLHEIKYCVLGMFVFLCKQLCVFNSYGTRCIAWENNPDTGHFLSLPYFYQFLKTPFNWNPQKCFNCYIYYFSS